MGGGRKQKRQQNQKAKKGRRGTARPAGANRPVPQPKAPEVPQSMDDFQLPPELQKMFDENKPKF